MAPIHSRLIEEDERGYQHNNASPMATAFAGSPSKAQAIAGRGAGAAGRYEDPAKMDRWDSRKLGDRGGDRGGDADGWQQQKARGGDNWRGGGAAAAGGVRGSLEVQRAAGPGGWGGREGGAELARPGTSAPKDNATGGRWVKDDDDWRARKQTGALPEPRYDWSDNRAPGLAAPGTAAVPGAAQRGPPPGFQDRERAPEWADSDPGQRARMTAADIEAERLRMQEQWKKEKGGHGHGAAQVWQQLGVGGWACFGLACPAQGWRLAPWPRRCWLPGVDGPQPTDVPRCPLSAPTNNRAP